MGLRRIPMRRGIRTPWDIRAGIPGDIPTADRADIRRALRAAA